MLSGSSKGSVWLFTPVLQRVFRVPRGTVFERQL